MISFKDRRLALGRTQQQLAASLEVSVRTVRNWERADRAPLIAWYALEGLAYLDAAEFAALGADHSTALPAIIAAKPVNIAAGLPPAQPAISAARAMLSKVKPAIIAAPLHPSQVKPYDASEAFEDAHEITYEPVDD